jgi:hypothetical protein
VFGYWSPYFLAGDPKFRKVLITEAELPRILGESSVPAPPEDDTQATF